MAVNTDFEHVKLKKPGAIHVKNAGVKRSRAE